MRELYRVEVAGRPDELSFPVPLERALEQVRKRAPREPLGDPLRIVRIEYDLDPKAPPTIYTPAMREVWRGTVLQFPPIGTLGVYVCKALSQHRFGNAGDWAAPDEAKTPEQVIEYLWRVARWQRAQGVEFGRTNGVKGLPFSEVIFRDQIATRLYAWTWRPYTGTFHAAHVHGSCYPLISTSRPCGDV